VTIIDLAEEVGIGHKRALSLAHQSGLGLRYVGKLCQLKDWQALSLRSLLVSEKRSPRCALLAMPPEAPAAEKPKAGGESENPASGMTIRQIADLCEAGDQTIRDWIGKTTSPESVEISTKIGEARRTSRAARFALPEVLAIIRAGGKHTLADLLEQNAKGENKSRAHSKPAPSLTAALMREYRLSVKDKVLSSSDVRRLLGLAEPAAPSAPVEPKAAAAVAADGFRSLLAVAEKGPAQQELNLGAGK